MILSREQINRYLRHIIIPEISGPGQKKLLESRTFIYGETVEDASVLVYYLAASGIGHITCCFGNNADHEFLFSNVRDLNSDVLIDYLADVESWNESSSIINAEGENSSFRILIGSLNSLTNILPKVHRHEFMPTILSVNSSWKGIVGTLRSPETLSSWLSLFKEQLIPGVSGQNFKTSNVCGNVFSTGFSGIIAVIELIKLRLGIGATLDDPLYFDMLNIEFCKPELTKLGNAISKLYSAEAVPGRLNSIHEIKEIRNCKALIVGSGGLGSPAAYALSMAGIGTIGLVDYDSVEISNLNRQIIHSTSRIGMPKAESGKVFINKINTHVNVIPYNFDLDRDNALELIKDYDIVIDGVDNIPSRYLINDACFFAGKPMIEAGVIRFDGMCMTIIPGVGPCYRCVYPEIPAPGTVPSCAETGVLGPVPGLMGFLQAAETVKVLTGQGTVLKDKMIFFDGAYLDFTIIDMDKMPECALCGANPSIDKLQEYVFVCSSKSDNE